MDHLRHPLPSSLEVSLNFAYFSQLFFCIGSPIDLVNHYSIVYLVMHLSYNIIHTGKIGSIDIDIDPVIEVNKEAMLFVHLYDTHNSTYSGSLNITFTLSINKSDVSNFESAPHRISHTMLYQHADTYTVQVIAKNEVSMINKSVHIEVVCKYNNWFSSL